MAQFISLSIIGLIIIFLCCLIKYKKQAFLISGYNEDEVADKDGLCNWVGGTVMWTGIIAIITGAVMWKYPTATMPAALFFGGSTVAIVIVTLSGTRRFKRKSD